MQINPLREKTKSFPWFLVLSLALNVAFVSYTVFQWQDGVLWLEVESDQQGALLSPFEDTTLEAEIAKLATKKDEELLSDLDDATPVANGYRTQELALALLRSRGYQVEDPLRPLHSWPQPLTPFSYHKPDGTAVSVHLFSTLTPADLHAVRSYIEQTPVPYTAEKIVELLNLVLIPENSCHLDRVKAPGLERSQIDPDCEYGRNLRSSNPRALTRPGERNFRELALGGDLSLLERALFRTDEWATLRSLFPSASEEDLFSLCKELGSSGFSQLVAKKESSFLLQFFAQHPSKDFADLLIAVQGDFLLKASDTVLLTLLPLLNPQSENTARFAVSLLKEQRKPPVWQAAQCVLARGTGDATLATLSREALLAWLLSPQKTHEVARAAPAATPVSPPVPASPPEKKPAQVAFLSSFASSDAPVTSLSHICGEERRYSLVCCQEV